MQNEQEIPRGEIYLLKRVRWSHFLTIPLPHQKGISNRALRIWGGFRGDLAKHLKVSPRRLLWVVTYEVGNSGENPHLHAYIGGLQQSLFLGDLAELCEMIRQRMALPGKVEICRYEARPGAISYLFKERNSHSMQFPSDDGRWPICSPNLRDTLRRGRM